MTLQGNSFKRRLLERKASFTLSVVLESRNLKKNFGGVIALDGVYFQVAKGKVT